MHRVNDDGWSGGPHWYNFNCPFDVGVVKIPKVRVLILKVTGKSTNRWCDI